MPKRGASPVVLYYDTLPTAQLSQHQLLFFDDRAYNFEDTCSCVLNVLAPVGARQSLSPSSDVVVADPLLTALTAVPTLSHLSYLKYIMHSPDHTGIPVSTILQLCDLLPRFTNIRTLVLDWDCTITVWDGLPFEIQAMFEKLPHDLLWTSLLGSLARQQAWTRLLTQMHRVHRVCILTSNEGTELIRFVLTQLAPELVDLPVVYVDVSHSKGREITEQWLKDASCKCYSAARPRRSARVAAVQKKPCLLGGGAENAARPPWRNASRSQSHERPHG